MDIEEYKEIPRLLLVRSINNLHLSPRAHAALRNAEINTLEDILKAEREKGLRRINGIGKAQYQDIQFKLEEIGILLDGSYQGNGIEDGVEMEKEAKSEPPQPPPADSSTQSEAEGIDPSPEETPGEEEKELPEEQPIEKASPRIITVSQETQTPIRDSTQLKTVAFIDYEHWFFALKNIHQRKPNLGTWFDDLKTRGSLIEATFFGDFSENRGMKDEINNIRMYSNRIIITENPDPHLKKDFTDFIMLDQIYQKIMTSPEIEQVVLFTGDGHFACVASYLRNFCSKVVGVYGVDRAISGQLEGISDWCVRIPFIDEPYEKCRDAILKNLKYAQEHSKSPTFQPTVRRVAAYYDLQEDLVEAELKRMIDEGLVYTVSKRSPWDYTVMLNVLKVNWNLVNQSIV